MDKYLPRVSHKKEKRARVTISIDKDHLQFIKGLAKASGHTLSRFVSERCIQSSGVGNLDTSFKKQLLELSEKSGISEVEYLQFLLLYAKEKEIKFSKSFSACTNLKETPEFFKV